MKLIALTLIPALCGLLGACQKDPDPNGSPCQTGRCNARLPLFAFVLADAQGTSLFAASTDGIGVAYREDNRLTQAPGLLYPQRAVPPHTHLVAPAGFLATKSKDAHVNTFYLTYQGHTDTLGLNIHAVPATPNNGGNSTPVVTFNGSPVQQVVSNPSYYVLKRR